jgi:hypothetical protein
MDSGTSRSGPSSGFCHALRSHNHLTQCRQRRRPNCKDIILCGCPAARDHWAVTDAAARTRSPKINPPRDLGSDALLPKIFSYPQAAGRLPHLWVPYWTKARPHQCPCQFGAFSTSTPRCEAAIVPGTATRLFHRTSAMAKPHWTVHRSAPGGHAPRVPAYYPAAIGQGLWHAVVSHDRAPCSRA